MRALFVFTPAESKRLIGKAVANLEEVKRALKDDKIIIGHGSTNVYVAEEILGKEKMSEKIVRDTYISGLVIRGTLCSTLGQEKRSIFLVNPIKPPALPGRLSEFGIFGNTRKPLIHEPLLAHRTRGSQCKIFKI